LSVTNRGSARFGELAAGFRAELPILLGVIPFGMVYGVLALKAGLSAAMAQAMSAVVFAGSAQFVVVQMVAGGAPAVMLVATVFVVNLRHALYSASVAPHIQHLSKPWKLALAYVLTDEAYAVAIRRYAEEGEADHRHWFFLGAGLTLWSGWQLSTLAGIVLGAQVPQNWSLEFALPLTFIALVVPWIKDRAGVAAAVVAAATVVFASDLPLKLGLLVAALAGITAGMLVDWIVKSRSA
jgi:4-azaleucine resistance transporter AzlC